MVADSKYHRLADRLGSYPELPRSLWGKLPIGRPRPFVPIRVVPSTGDFQEFQEKVSSSHRRCVLSAVCSKKPGLGSGFLLYRSDAFQVVAKAKQRKAPNEPLLADGDFPKTRAGGLHPNAYSFLTVCRPDPLSGLFVSLSQATPPQNSGAAIKYFGCPYLASNLRLPISSIRECWPIRSCFAGSSL